MIFDITMEALLRKANEDAADKIALQNKEIKRLSEALITSQENEIALKRELAAAQKLLTFLDSAWDGAFGGASEG